MNIDQAIDIISERSGIIYNSKNPIWSKLFINPNGEPQFQYDEIDILNGVSMLDENWEVANDHDNNIIKANDRGNDLSLFEALKACKSGEIIYSRLWDRNQRIIYRPNEPRFGGFILQYDSYSEIHFYTQEGSPIFTAHDVYYKKWKVL